MQIDFHHAVTYVLARLAGFNYEQANIIAYSSQYVDDSNCDVFVKFNNGALYKPICSAHKILDYRNFDQHVCDCRSAPIIDKNFIIIDLELIKSISLKEIYSFIASKKEIIGRR